MKISDDILMAYADGELDTVQRAQVERAIEQDPQIGTQIESYQRLQRQLNDALSGVLDEPVPERLLATVRKAVPATSNIVDFKTHRVGAHAEQPRKWSGREWGALAACLVVGVLAGVLALNLTNGGWVSTRNGELVASGDLADALTEQLASTQTGSEAIQLKLSYRSQTGEDCRAFVAREQQALAGLACRRGNEWRVKLLSETAAAAQGEFRQAGSDLPPSILAQVSREISGEAFDAEAEMAARATGWKK